jgi:hypothetical protein
MVLKLDEATLGKIARAVSSWVMPAPREVTVQLPVPMLSVSECKDKVGIRTEGSVVVTGNHKGRLGERSPGECVRSTNRVYSISTMTLGE